MGFHIRLFGRVGGNTVELEEEEEDQETEAEEEGKGETGKAHNFPPKPNRKKGLFFLSRKKPSVHARLTSFSRKRKKQSKGGEAKRGREKVEEVSNQDYFLITFPP